MSKVVRFYLFEKNNFKIEKKIPKSSKKSDFPYDLVFFAAKSDPKMSMGMSLKMFSQIYDGMKL